MASHQFPQSLPGFLFRNIARTEPRASLIFEAVIGIVTDINDPEKLGRIKVKFPTLPGEDTSWWAPIVSLGGGAERGWYFLPELEDEVCVMFEHGDIRRPVVLGALWNGQDAPPEQNDGSNKRRIIVSREGSKIIFDDDEGTITLEDGGGIGKIVISKDNKITIEASSGDASVQAPADEMVIVADEMMVDGSSNLKIDAGGALKITGDSSVTIDGGSMLQCTSSKVEVQNGVGSASEGSDSCEEVADPIE